MAANFSELIDGLSATLRFSNRFELVYYRLFRRRAPLVLYVWRNRLCLVCDARVGDNISVQEIFGRRIYDAFLQRCRFGSSISYVNVGANVGAFDLLLLDWNLRVSRGVSVELNPATCHRCEVNLLSNGVENVRVINAAVADSDGCIEFTPSAISAGDNIYAAAAPGVATQKIPSLTLATLVDSYFADVPVLDLLKLDCEAAEYAILRNSAETLRRFRNVIVEFHQPCPNESIDAARAALAAAGLQSIFRVGTALPFTELFGRA